MDSISIDIKKLLVKYRKWAIQHGQGSSEGDYRKTNKAYKELTKIFNLFENNQKIADIILSILLRDDDVNTRIFAASHSLGLSKYIEQSKEVLKQIANEKKFGIISFNAEMTLRVWEKQGYLKF